MTVDVNRAAAELLQSFHAPAGCVNTLGMLLGGKKIIKVYVDSGYWHRLGRVPRRFKGFTVEVQKRGAIETTPGLSRAS